MHARLFSGNNNYHTHIAWHKNEIAHFSVNAANQFNRASNLTTAAIFASASRVVLDSLAQYLFLPVSVLTAIITAILAWRRVKLEECEPHSIAKAVLETLVACALTAALIGVLAFTSLFSLAAPVISAATLGAKSLFSIGSAIYYAVKARCAASETERDEYRSKIKNAAMDGIIGLFVTSALVALIIFATPVVKLISMLTGIGGSIAACIIALTRVNKHHSRLKAEFDESDSKQNHAVNPSLTTHARLIADVGKYSDYPEHEQIRNVKSDHTLPTIQLTKNDFAKPNRRASI
jgi:hypothetical protein